MTKHKFKVEGIHCKSCKTLIEEEVKQMHKVEKINVDHLSSEVELETNDSIDGIYKTIEKIGYKINKTPSTSEKDTKVDIDSSKNIKKSKFPKKIIVTATLLILIAFAYYLINSLGLFSIMGSLNEKNISYTLIFIIGIIASFHCIGMCGGLVVTYSASGETEKKMEPHLFYNGGRLISYTIIGGILGSLGSFFGINPTFSGIVILVAAVFMVLMGISLFTRHAWLEKIKLKTPERIAKFLYRNKKSDKPKGPFIIGLLTGFMPCGPLQAMQLYALTSGSAITGALSMLVYSLGTVPMMIGFGSLITMLSTTKIKQMMKISGALVIVLGLFMFNRGLVNFGMGLSSLIPANAQSQSEFKITGDIEEFQVIRMDINYSGYSPNVMYIKKDIPVRWIISDKGATGCTNEIFLYLENETIKRKIVNKETIIEFTPSKLGEIKFSCWMKMFWGKFIVSEGGQKNILKTTNETTTLPKGTCNGSGSCGGTCGQVTCGCSK